MGIFLSNKCVVCQKKITWRFSLCRKCGKIYGKHKRDWPEWLRDYVNAIRREKYRQKLDADRLVSLDDCCATVEEWDEDRFSV